MGVTIAERYKYMTLPQAAKRLGLHPASLRRRLKIGVFPVTSYINKSGVNFFDEDWIRETRAIIAKSFEWEILKKAPRKLDENNHLMPFPEANSGDKLD